MCEHANCRMLPGACHCQGDLTLILRGSADGCGGRALLSDPPLAAAPAPSQVLASCNGQRAALLATMQLACGWRSGMDRRPRVRGREILSAQRLRRRASKLQNGGIRSAATILTAALPLPLPLSLRELRKVTTSRPTEASALTAPKPHPVNLGRPVKKPPPPLNSGRPVRSVKQWAGV